MYKGVFCQGGGRLLLEGNSPQQCDFSDWVKIAEWLKVGCSDFLDIILGTSAAFG